MSDEVFDNDYSDFSPDSDSTDSSEVFGEQLREVMDRIDVSNSLTTPIKGAIDHILQLAADAVGSEVASVLVRDGNEGGLKFLTAIGDVKDELLKLRIPPGKGIAGLVFGSGQPMAISDVSTEGSFWSEADKKTGFKTITLLATPLQTDTEVVGILQVINRKGDPPYPPFVPEEMNHAAYFADTLARLVDAHDIAELVESIFDHSMKAMISGVEGTEESAADLREWVNSLVTAPEHRDMGMVWISLREVFRKGDAERELCLELLETLARFAQKRSIENPGYVGF